MTRRSLRALLGLVLAACLTGPVLLAGGCTSKKTTTTTETVAYPEGSTLPDGTVAERDTTLQVTRDTHVVEEKDAGFCGGVLGCTAKVTWEIVKIPFRVAGFLLDILI